jgi:gas vesicle protein
MLRYEIQIKLAGIIYLHRITDSYMRESHLHNIRIFEAICGDQALKKAVLVTTMWDKGKTLADPQTHNKRERWLFDNYWKRMINYGASTARFLNSSDSAWKIIDLILQHHETEVLLLQEELVDLKRSLNETQAGKTIYSDLQRLLAEQRDTVRSLADQLREESNPQLAEKLELEVKRIQKDFDKTRNEMQSLKIPFGKSLMLLFSKKSPGVRILNSNSIILLS